MQFRHYPAERLMIASITSRLTSDENILRRWLMQRIIDHGTPFKLDGEEIENSGPPDARSLMKGLLDKRAIVVDADNNVNFVYPVSALPTHHKVRLDDGRSFSAMCAIDALGAAFTFNRNSRVESKCSECGQPLFVAVENGEIAELSPETAHVLHVDLNKADNWAGSC